MTIGDTAAAKILCQVFGLTEWPEHGFQNFLLHTGQGPLGLDYAPENESLRLEAALAEMPADGHPDWPGVLLAGSAPDEERAEIWLGLRGRSVTLQTVRFPGQDGVDDLAQAFNAFAAAALAWRGLLGAGHLKASPAEILEAAV